MREKKAFYTYKFLKTFKFKLLIFSDKSFEVDQFLKNEGNKLKRKNEKRNDKI